MKIESKGFWIRYATHDAEYCPVIIRKRITSGVRACCVSRMICAACGKGGLDHMRPSLKCLYGAGQFNAKSLWCTRMVLDYPEKP